MPTPQVSDVYVTPPPASYDPAIYDAKGENHVCFSAPEQKHVVALRGHSLFPITKPLVVNITHRDFTTQARWLSAISGYRDMRELNMAGEGENDWYSEQVLGLPKFMRNRDAKGAKAWCAELFGHCRNPILPVLALRKEMSNTDDVFCLSYISTVCLQYWTIVRCRWVQYHPTDAPYDFSYLPNLFLMYEKSDFQFTMTDEKKYPLSALSACIEHNTCRDVARNPGISHTDFVYLVCAAVAKCYGHVDCTSGATEPHINYESFMKNARSFCVNKLVKNHALSFASRRFRQMPFENTRQLLVSLCPPDWATIDPNLAFCNDDKKRWYPQKTFTRRRYNFHKTDLDNAVTTFVPTVYGHMVFSPYRPVAVYPLLESKCPCKDLPGWCGLSIHGFSPLALFAAQLRYYLPVRTQNDMNVACNKMASVIDPVVFQRASTSNSTPSGTSVSSVAAMAMLDAFVMSRNIGAIRTRYSFYMHANRLCLSPSLEAIHGSRVMLCKGEGLQHFYNESFLSYGIAEAAPRLWPLDSKSPLPKLSVTNPYHQHISSLKKGTQPNLALTYGAAVHEFRDPIIGLCFQLRICFDSKLPDKSDVLLFISELGHRFFDYMERLTLMISWMLKGGASTDIGRMLRVPVDVLLTKPQEYHAGVHDFLSHMNIVYQQKNKLKKFAFSKRDLDMLVRICCADDQTKIPADEIERREGCLYFVQPTHSFPLQMQIERRGMSFERLVRYMIYLFRLSVLFPLIDYHYHITRRQLDASGSNGAPANVAKEVSARIRSILYGLRDDRTFTRQAASVLEDFPQDSLERKLLDSIVDPTYTPSITSAAAAAVAISRGQSYSTAFMMHAAGGSGMDHTSDFRRAVAMLPLVRTPSSAADDARMCSPLVLPMPRLISGTQRGVSGFMMSPADASKHARARIRDLFQQDLACFNTIFKPAWIEARALARSTVLSEHPDLQLAAGITAEVLAEALGDAIGGVAVRRTAVQELYRCHRTDHDFSPIMRVCDILSKKGVISVSM
jgi:hypothetical protein